MGFSPKAKPVNDFNLGGRWVYRQEVLNSNEITVMHLLKKNTRLMIN